MRRGRPTKSSIRQNIIELLFFLGKAYGYRIHKIYKQIFPNCTREVIYYHLKKGMTLGEFEIQEIKQEKGDYSWGIIVEKKYYKLGPNAKPLGNERVKKFFDEHPEFLEKDGSKEAKTETELTKVEPKETHLTKTD